MGGIRVPVNVAYAAQHGGEGRWSVVTGWAIRDMVGKEPVEEKPRKEWRKGWRGM